MSRMQRFDWQKRLSPSVAARRRCKLRRPSPLTRRLRVETLEDRRLLAAVSVTNDFDLVNGDTSSIANLIAAPGDDGISLREAIEAANADVAADTIDISFGGTILLTQGELVISNSLTISGPNSGTLTIDASGNDPTPDENNGDGSRVFNIDDSDDGNLLEVFLEDLTITGGDVTGEGGGIRSLENLTIDDSSITGNSTSGDNSVSLSYASGGGISSRIGDLAVIDSTVSNNSTYGRADDGGGIYSNTNLTVINSTISGNATRYETPSYLSTAIVSAPHTVPIAFGGGIRAKNLVITDSTVSGNYTLGDQAHGGGIFADYLTMTNTTVSNNSTAGEFAFGGGIHTRSASISDSTISRNSTAGVQAWGGGILFQGGNDSSILGSSISENFTTGLGAAGGGIATSLGSIGSSSLTITESTIKGNSTSGDYAVGGGIFTNLHNLNVFSSKIFDNSTAGESASGGGIRTNLGEATIRYSAIYNNSTSGTFAHGGGILSARTLLLTNSTISGNKVTGESASGGGIFQYPNPSGQFFVSHSTITGNSATEGSGGIEVGEFFNIVAGAPLANSIISGNWLTPTGLPPVASDVSSDGLELSYNLIGEITGDFTETPGSVNYFGIDPLLGPLADNGGPTKTHALLAGSPAIDAGNPAIASAPTFDQRGNPFLRLADGDGDFIQQIDIGAFEVPMTLVVTTHVDEMDGLFDFNSGSGLLSLREAMLLANMVPQAININFALWLNSRTIEIDLAGLGPLPSITDHITIDATSLPGGLTIHAGYGLDGTPETGDGIRVFDIDDGNNENSISVGLFGLTITGGDVADATDGGDELGGGGGIRSFENLTILESTITGNSSTRHASYPYTNGKGGGISSQLGNLTVIDSTVSNNSTFGGFADGGGIYSDSNVSISGSTISGNFTQLELPPGDDGLEIASLVSVRHRPQGPQGGGIYANELVITDSTISDNSTLGDASSGGGIFADNLTLTSSTVRSNSTAGFGSRGGGIHTRNAMIMDSTISGNSTTGSHSPGGGINFARDGVSSVSNSNVSGNYTTGINSSGGGIFTNGYSREIDTFLTITESTISGNTTLGERAYGGGIYSREVKLNITASSIHGNSTAGENSHGGGLSTNLGELTIGASAIYDNRTTGIMAHGGGIASLGDSLVIDSSTISGNEASGDSSAGGGVFSHSPSGSLVVSHSTITNNRALGEAGGIFNLNISFLPEILSHSIVYGNWLTPTGLPPVASDVNSGGLDLGYSFVGTGDFTEIPGTINYFGIDPLLGPLADNGGPTKTHALLFGSPALDAGDPNIAFDANEFDQRGDGFFRVAEGGFGGLRIDVGAYELQVSPIADFDADSRVTGLDFLAWQRGFTSTSATLVEGDADYDHDVDSYDLDVWEALFGSFESAPILAAAANEYSVAEESVDNLETDAAFSELAEEEFALHVLN